MAAGRGDDPDLAAEQLRRLVEALSSLPPLDGPAVVPDGVPQPLDERFDLPRLKVARPRIRIPILLAAELAVIVSWLVQGRALRRAAGRADEPIGLRFDAADRRLVHAGIGRCCAHRGCPIRFPRRYLDDRPHAFDLFAGLLARFVELHARDIDQTPIRAFGEWMTWATSDLAYHRMYCVHTTERLVDLFQLRVAPELRRGSFIVTSAEGKHWIHDAAD